jgi:hypothetical protein
MTTPSWVGAPRPVPRSGASRPPATLVVAVVGVVALAVGEAAHVLTRDDLRVPLQVALVAVIAVQLLAGALALRRSSAAAMLLLLCGVTALVASLATGRVVGAVVAGVVLVLLALSLRWFPTYEP